MAAGKKLGYCYPSGLEKTLCKWDLHVPLVTKGLREPETGETFGMYIVRGKCIEDFDREN
jgi:hypothetical protein